MDHIDSDACLPQNFLRVLILYLTAYKMHGCIKRSPISTEQIKKKSKH